MSAHPLDRYIDTDFETYYALSVFLSHPEGEVSPGQLEVLEEEGVIEADVGSLLEKHENVLWKRENGAYTLTDYAQEWYEEMKAGDFSLGQPVMEHFEEVIREEVDWARYPVEWP